MIACVNFFPISSEYHWKGEIASSNEIVAILKTTKTNWPKVRDFIEENHPYETPCIIKLAEVEANQGYADWVQGRWFRVCFALPNIYPRYIMIFMKKKILMLLGLIILVGAVSYFNDGTRNSSEQKTLKLGAVIPLTGNYASIGENIKRGLDMAKQDFESKEKDISIEMVYEDGCLPKDVTSAVQKLINIDKVKIINQFCAIGIVPSLEITEPNKIINVEIAANVDDLLGKKYFFSPNFAVRDNAKTIADFAINDLKTKKAAFIYYNTQFGKDYRKYIGQRFTELGGQIVADEMTSLDVTDFRTNLIKIKDAKPDIIFVTQLTGGLGTIIKQSREIGLSIPLVGNYQNEDPIVLQTAGVAAEGFVISSADPSVIGNDDIGFRQRFKDKYGVEPDVFASNAYDAFNLEIQAQIKCGEDTDCIREELHKVSNYSGVSGNITINENGVAEKPTIFKIVKDGKFVLY